jgi:nucleoid-associated protein Lsr2
MVQRVVTERFDDLDGSEAVETVRFGYAGRNYEIDLNEEHATALDELLSPYVEHARRVERATERTRRGRKTEEEHRHRPEELRAIRQWAREQGMQVSDRGRIAADIMAKYDAAHMT